MTQRLHQWLHNPEGAGVAQRDVPLAMGALLVRVARSDHEYVRPEMDTIDQVLALLHDLTLPEAAELRAACEQIEATAPDTARFAAVLRDGIPYSERLSVALALWQVVMADGIRRPEESAVVALAENVLGVLSTDLPSAGPDFARKP